MSKEVKYSDIVSDGGIDPRNTFDRQAQQDYERGFIDGMQRQAQSSVDRAVNAMSQRTWVGLTDEEITDIWAESSPYYHEDDFARAIEAKLKEKNQ